MSGFDDILSCGRETDESYLDDEPVAEKRTSFRCRVTRSQQAAALEIGRRRIPVRLCNESSGGFSAWVCEDVNLKQDQVGVLLTCVGGSEVRIIHVAKVDPAQAEGAGVPEAVLRIGLERLREIDETRHAAAAPAGLWSRLQTGLLPSSSALAVVLCLSVTLFVVSCYVYVLPHSQTSIVDQFNPFWRKTTTRTWHTNLPLPTVMREVGLNERQQAQILEITAMMAGALDEMDAHWQHDDPEVRRCKRRLILEAATHELLDPLSEQQRQDREELLAPPK